MWDRRATPRFHPVIRKTTYFESGRWFKPPRVTTDCYARGTGVDQ